MDEKKLYIVSTYYHALIACVKQLVNFQSADLICTHYIPDSQSLAYKIADSKIFENTYCIGPIEEYHPKNKFDYIFNLHRKNAKLIEQQMTIKFDNYSEINIFHDDIWAAHYMKDKRIKYRLIEDALDSFKSVSKSCFSYMMPKNNFKSVLKRFCGIGYSYFGVDKLAYEIEVNDICGVEIADFASKKLKEKPRRILFDSINEEYKKILCKIFMKKIQDISPEKSVLLLTQPLFIDSLVRSETDQIKYYAELVKRHYSGLDLVIKPHPRDMTDYSSEFPSAVIIDKNMPVEILSIIGVKPFKRVITYNSSCAGWIPCEEIKTIEL